MGRFCVYQIRNYQWKIVLQNTMLIAYYGSDEDILDTKLTTEILLYLQLLWIMGV